MYPSRQISVSNENLASQQLPYQLRTQSFPRTSTRDSSFFSPSAPSFSFSSSSSSESNIFTVTRSVSGQSGLHSRFGRRQSAATLGCLPLRYNRHCNLDVQPLSWRERLLLVRLHYLKAPNLIRLICVLICLGWFIYVAQNSLGEYVQHDTIVHLAYEPPTTSKPCAVTVCTHEVLLAFPRSSYSNISALKLLNRDDTENVLRVKPILKATANVEIDCNLVHTTMDTVSFYKRCTDWVPLVMHMSEGQRCFTYFSDVHGETTRAKEKHPQLLLNFDFFPQIIITVKGDYLYAVPLNTVPPNSSEKQIFSEVSVTIHDPDILPHMMNAAFHKLLPGKKLILPFVKRIQKLLPPPYSTRCVKYTSKKAYESLMPQESQYRSRGECILECTWQKLNGGRHCADAYSMFTAGMISREESIDNLKFLKEMLQHEGSLSNETINGKLSEFFKICPYANHSFSRYLQAKETCLEECPNACHINTFTEDVPLTEKTDNSRVAQVYINWVAAPVTRIIHRPKWELPFFLGQIGGELHIWLGVSVIHLIWYGIRLFRSGEIPKTNLSSVFHCISSAALERH